MTTTKWRRIQWLATWIVSHTEDSLRMALQWIDLMEPTRLNTLFQFTCTSGWSNWSFHFLLLKMSIWTTQLFQRCWIVHNRFGVQSRRSLFILFTSVINQFEFKSTASYEAIPNQCLLKRSWQMKRSAPKWFNMLCIPPNPDSFDDSILISLD